MKPSANEGRTAKASLEGPHDPGPIEAGVPRATEKHCNARKDRTMTAIDSNNPTHHLSLIPDQDQIAAQFGGDAAAELAAMVFLFARDRKSDAAEQRELMENRIQSAEAKQVREMYRQADDAMWGAIAAGAGKL